MSGPLNDPAVTALLQKRLVGTLATHNVDGSAHLTSIWYLFESGCFFVATSSRTKKARNIAARHSASLMIDSRKPGAERGVTVIGHADLITGPGSHEINERLHRRYLSDAAIADPAVGPVFAAFDDVTIRLTPLTWFTWDMAALDMQAFGGRLGKAQGYMLPLD